MLQENAFKKTKFHHFFLLHIRKIISLELIIFLKSKFEFNSYSARLSEKHLVVTT